jgi:hypothetical protein
MVKQRISLKDVDISINGKIIGGAESVEVTVTREGQEVAYEGGNYKGVEIVDGKIAISGQIVRAFIDVELLNELFPNQPLMPDFTLSGKISSGKTPGRDVSVFGCKLDSVNISDLGLDGYAKNTMPFKALDWRFG